MEKVDLVSRIEQDPTNVLAATFLGSLAVLKALRDKVFPADHVESPWR